MEKLQEKIDGNINLKNNIENLINTKMRLGDLLERESRGARIRTKVEEIKEGERSTRYFFSKEHSNGEKKQIKALLIEKKTYLKKMK